MGPLVTILFLLLAPVIACTNESPTKASIEHSTQHKINRASNSPSVDFEGFTLITRTASNDSFDAKNIIELKRTLPLAAQRKDSGLLATILAKEFTFRSELQFLNRNEFIKSRITPQANVTMVKYENLVLQFFGNVAVLTYRNTLKGRHDLGKSDSAYYHWADIYIREDGKWKLGSVHLIDATGH